MDILYQALFFGVGITFGILAPIALFLLFVFWLDHKD